MKAGDHIIITTAEKSYEGSYLPSENEALLTIKLESGYNIGINRTRVKDIKVVAAKKEKKNIKETEGKTIKQDSKKPLISILHTGGTIASKVDYETGGVTAQFSPDELLKLFPELADDARIDSRLVGQMMSENMRFDHYNMLAEAVEKEVKKGAQGIIITHGTDTLHYTSAALSFALENVPVPVILVGAQRSSDRGSSDAALNLLSASFFATQTKTAGVFVCMHANMSDESCLLLPGNKCRKMHTSRRDAFRAINTTAYASVDYAKKKITILRDLPKTPSGKETFVVKGYDTKLKVGLFKSHTHMYAEELDVYKKFDGLVVEGTALGQLPTGSIDASTTENENIHKALVGLTKHMPVVMASQSIYGRIDMNVYSEGRKNIAAGILGNYHDMTPETTFVKLAWLLSHHKKNVAELIGQDLRGEISKRIDDESFLN